MRIFVWLAVHIMGMSLRMTITIIKKNLNVSLSNNSNKLFYIGWAISNEFMSYGLRAGSLEA